MNQPETDIVKVLQSFQSRRPKDEKRPAPNETDNYPFQDYNYLVINATDVFLNPQVNNRFFFMQQYLLDLHTQLPYWDDGKLGEGKRVFCLLPSGYSIDDKRPSSPCIPTPNLLFVANTSGQVSMIVLTVSISSSSL